MAEISLFGGVPPKASTREILLAFVSAEQSVSCDYCGWEIPAGELFKLVVIDTCARFHCQDHERCVRRAGK